MRALIVLLFVTLTGCVSVTALMTPALSVTRDKFDDATIIRQPPISAASSVSDGWLVLGFEWNSNRPDIVYIDAGMQAIGSITAVEFKIDGKAVTPPIVASEESEIAHGWTVRRFIVPLQDFLIIARGSDVKMRLVQGSNFSVSEFGPEHPAAAVNSKFKPFIDKVREHSKSI